MLPNFDWPLIVERLRTQVTWLEMIADGGNIAINGVPWRVALKRQATPVNPPLEPRHAPVNATAKRRRQRALAGGGEMRS